MQSSATDAQGGCVYLADHAIFTLLMRVNVWTVAVSTMFFLLIAVVLRLAWISDDAYITLRTVENWLSGHGPVWNVGERVQTYTHPLWMLLLSLGRYLTGEHYYTTIFLGVFCSVSAALLLGRLAGNAASATAVLAILIWSRAFGDFSTSGLETPLVFLLAALLATIAPSLIDPRRQFIQKELLETMDTATETGLHRLLTVSLLVGLAATTRMDMALLFAPSMIACARGLPRAQAISRIIVGTAPLTAWCLFATIYYGTPFPITAYAKAISVGIDPLDLLRQGGFYLVYVVTTDPLTMVVIAGGIAIGLMRRELRCRSLALGALLYCCYVIKVGGDFMSDRFFAPPFVMALAIVARFLANATKRTALMVFATATGLAFVPWLVVCIGAKIPGVPEGSLAFVPGLPAFFRAPASDQPPKAAFHGIIDERSFYYSALGLLAPRAAPGSLDGMTIPVTGGLSSLMRAQGREKPAIVPHGQVGRYAFEAGDLVHFVDPWLCDPMLMRLPVWDKKGWRIGHFIRRMPEGYLESLAAGNNLIVHPGLRRYYEALQTVIKEPVFADLRLAKLWELMRGDFDADLNSYVAGDQDDCYRNPQRVRVKAEQLQKVQPDGALWFDLTLPRIVYEAGIAVEYGKPQKARSLSLQVIGNLAYKVAFYWDGKMVGEQKGSTAARFMGDPGLRTLQLEVPVKAMEFDSLWIDVINPTSESVGCIGSIVLLP